MGADRLPSSADRLAVTACHECDLVLSEDRAASHRPRSLVCPRCGAPLHRSGGGSPETMLALACAAMVLLAVANTYPVLGLEINGQRVDSTVFGAVEALWRQRMQPVALLVLLTTIVAPLLEVAAVIWLALPLWRGRRPRAFAAIFRALQLARPWAMTEVLILGMLVATVKLAHFADLLPGAGIWAFGGLMLVLAAVSTAAEPHGLWRAWEEAEA